MIAKTMVESLRNNERKLGRSGLSVGRIGLGCTTFGREIDEAACFAIMDHALELGITLFDTAESYGGGQAQLYRKKNLGIEDQREVSHEMHSSEKIIGRWFRDRGVRKEVVLLTKPFENFTREHLPKSLDGSLERLQTDVIDLYMYHRFDPATPLEESVLAMDAVVKSGRVRAGGCSNHSAEQLQTALDLAARQGFARFEAVQNNYNLAVPNIAADLLPLCEREQVGVITYSPLGAGFLTGKYTPDRAAFPKGSRFDVIPGHADVYFSDRNFRLVERLKEFAVRTGVPAARLAMSWVFQNPAVGCVLVGARTTQHLDNAVDALNMEFPPEWLQEMNSWE